MPMFICSLNWTDQGIRSVKDAPKRAQAARDLAKKVGVEIKEVYMTSGDNDLLVIVDTPNGDNVAKFALALGSQGNVRTRTVRAWPQSEFQKLISELPYRHSAERCAGSEYIKNSVKRSRSTRLFRHDHGIRGAGSLFCQRGRVGGGRINPECVGCQAGSTTTPP